MTDKIVVLSTCDSQKQAKTIAHRLVERKLAACVNIVPGATSVYRWQDKIEESAEYLLLIKSSRPLFEKLSQELSAIHSYQIPECIALPIVEGCESYLDWLARALQ